jgi:hypothetical protein
MSLVELSQRAASTPGPGPGPCWHNSCRLQKSGGGPYRSVSVPKDIPMQGQANVIIRAASSCSCKMHHAPSACT